MKGHMLTPSTGGKDALPYTVLDQGSDGMGDCGGTGGSSVVEAPASAANVGYQSTRCVVRLFQLPRTFGGTNPPLTKAATRMPPSQLLCFSPRRGKLVPSKTPPLSDEYTIMCLGTSPSLRAGRGSHMRVGAPQHATVDRLVGSPGHARTECGRPEAQMRTEVFRIGRVMFGHCLQAAVPRGQYCTHWCTERMTVGEDQERWTGRSSPPAVLAQDGGAPPRFKWHGSAAQRHELKRLAPSARGCKPSESTLAVCCTPRNTRRARRREQMWFHCSHKAILCFA